MSPPPAADLKRAHRTSYGTAIRRTTIYSDSPDPNAPSLWVRQAPHPEHPFTRLTDQVQVNALLPAGLDTWVLGLGDHAHRRYALPGSASLAGRLIDGSPASGTARDAAAQLVWPDVFHRLGRLLAGLHQVAGEHPELLTDVEPPARTRLRAWWSAERENTGAPGARFHAGLPGHVTDHLTGHLVTDLRPGGTLVHGWIGLGQVVQGQDGGLACLLGEDIGTAPPEYDLGALVAQVVELVAFAQAGNRLDPRVCREQLLAGYLDGGGRADPATVDAFAIEHVVRHVCDFVQFAAHDPQELPAWARLVGWLGENYLKGRS